MAMLRNLLLLAAAPITHTGLTAAPSSGSVAMTTVSGGGHPIATSIYGPFEDGFGSAQESTLRDLGCSPPSLGHVPAGIDTFTSEQMIAAACNVELPRVENGQHIGLLDECGHDTSDGHYVENLNCLYDDSDVNAGHSTKVGEATDAAKTGVYGKWEDRSRLAIPALDACNGHFGVTPESNGAVVYHHHVAGLPPFVIGCFGPADDPNMPDGKLVSPHACRELYPECGDNDYVTVTTSSGSKLYDPYCPCFSGFSNVDMALVPPSPPPHMPAALDSPSPPPPISVTWPGCTEQDITGDFDHNGRATLGDAVHIANGRLEYGSTNENPIKCLDGDFDSDGSFTLNDAAHVAEAQFSKAYLPWEKRRQLSADKPASKSDEKRKIAMTMKKGELPLEVQVHLERADSLDSAWKALSVQFDGGKIASVAMPQVGGEIITAQHKGAFFQAASLSGSGAAWPIGHAATVTFEVGTDMAALQIDYGSMNSYVVLQADPVCKPAKGAPCATLIPTVVKGTIDVPTPNATSATSATTTTSATAITSATSVQAATASTDLIFVAALAVAALMIVMLITTLTRCLRRGEPVAVPTDVKVAVVGVPAADVKLEPASPRTQSAEKC
jgi:hypothetical protein